MKAAYTIDKAVTAWEKISKSEKQSIEKLVNDSYIQYCQIHDEILQTKWIKLDIINWHRQGKTEDEILQLLAGWRSVYRNVINKYTDKEFDDWIKDNIESILPNFDVDEYIKTLKGEEFNTPVKLNAI